MLKPNNLNLIKLIASLLKELYACLFFDSSKYIRSSEILFFCHDHNRAIRLNGKYYSPLTDSLGERFEKYGLRIQTIAAPWSRFDGTSTFSSTYTINRKYYISLIMHRAMRILKEMRFSKSSVSPILEFYERLLVRTQAKLLITIGAPSHLSHAARRAKVCHFEILHGYGYCEVPFGWDTLPKEQLPQGLLSMDTLSTSTFSSHFSNSMKVWQIENPFNNSEHTQALAWGNGQIDSKSGGRKYERNIIIILQWGYEQNSVETPELSNIIDNGMLYEEILELIIRNHSRVYFRIRLHPVQMRTKNLKMELIGLLKRRLVGLSNWDYEYSSEAPLVVAAADCVGAITMSSSACYELATLGIETLALCPTLRGDGCNNNFFSDLVEDGYVTKMSVDDLLASSWIHTVEKRHVWDKRVKALSPDRLVTELLRCSGLLETN